MRRITPTVSWRGLRSGLCGRAPGSLSASRQGLVLVPLGVVFEVHEPRDVPGDLALAGYRLRVQGHRGAVYNGCGCKLVPATRGPACPRGGVRCVGYMSCFFFFFPPGIPGSPPLRLCDFTDDG